MTYGTEVILSFRAITYMYFTPTSEMPGSDGHYNNGKLTHLDRDKRSPFSDDIFKCISWKKIY